MGFEVVEAWDGEIVIMPTSDERLMLLCSCGWDYLISGTPILETVNNIAVDHWKHSHEA